MTSQDYYNRDKTFSYKVVYYAMKWFIIFALIAIFCTTLQAQKVFVLPADSSHAAISVYKNRITIDNAAKDEYLLEMKFEPCPASVKGEMASIFVYDAIDKKGQKWVISVCRTNAGIYAIKFENDKLMVVYQ